MSDETRSVLHDWFERVWNQGKVEAIDELLADDAKIHGLRSPDGGDVGGPTEFRVMHKAFREAFPDMQIDVEDTLVEGDRIAFRCTVRGTHKGAAFGLDATGKPILFNGMGFAVVRNGQIAEAWNTFDFQAMNEQIGRS